MADANDPALPYDLLLSGGQVLDLDTGSRRSVDLAYRGGRLADMGPRLDPASARQVVNVIDGLMVPGFVDLHTHVFAGVGDGAPVDEIGVTRATPTIVDAGSAGAATIVGLRRAVAHARTRVRAWLNLSTVGLVDTRFGELVPGAYLDPAAAIAAARRHHGFVIGIKARLSTYAAGGGAGRILAPLVEVGEATGLPVMVHVGDTDEALDDIVTWLRSGDVVTHAFTGRKHGILDARGRLRPVIVEARQRGVLFDSARGRNHLTFPVLRVAVRHGFLPDTLSTDVSAHLVADSSYSLATIAGYLMALGVDIESVLKAMTLAPARAVGMEDELRVEVGQPGDSTIVRLESGRFTYFDVDGRRLVGARRLLPLGSVRAGRFYPFSPTGGPA